jgi:DNA-binding XRE family transcriptional regulator
MIKMDWFNINMAVPLAFRIAALFDLPIETIFSNAPE